MVLSGGFEILDNNLLTNTYLAEQALYYLDSIY